MMTLSDGPIIFAISLFLLFRKKDNTSNPEVIEVKVRKAYPKPVVSLGVTAEMTPINAAPVSCPTEIKIISIPREEARSLAPISFRTMYFKEDRMAIPIPRQASAA